MTKFPGLKVIGEIAAMCLVIVMVSFLFGAAYGACHVGAHLFDTVR